MFYRDGSLFAAPFDVGHMRLTGTEVRVMDGVGQHNELPQFDISANGVLVYRRGLDASHIVAKVDAAGNLKPVLSSSGPFVTPRVSPDGKRLALGEMTAAGPRVTVYDLARGTSAVLSNDGSMHSGPVWVNDRELIAASSAGLVLSLADGSGQRQRLGGDVGWYASALSRDGKFLAGGGYTEEGNNIRSIWIAPFERSGEGYRLGKVAPLPKSAGDQLWPVFSPDRHWLAYMSREGESYQILVVALTADGQATGRKWQVTTTGGYDPIWPSGNQIFYKDEANHIAVIHYSVEGDSFVAERPRRWMQKSLTSYPNMLFDMSPDGKEAYAVVDADSETPDSHVRVVLNFGDEVRRRTRTVP